MLKTEFLILLIVLLVISIWYSRSTTKEHFACSPPGSIGEVKNDKIAGLCCAPSDYKLKCTPKPNMPGFSECKCTK
jgi:hypothetical protein